MGKFHLLLAKNNQVVSVDGVMVEIKANQLLIASTDCQVLGAVSATIEGYFNFENYKKITLNNDLKQALSLLSNATNRVVKGNLELTIASMITIELNNLSPIIQQIVDNINENYQLHDFQPKQFMSMLPFSYHHLRKLFTAQVGQSPNAYLTTLRLNYAKQLLTTSELTVVAVANSCGYDDPLYFSRIYRKHFNLSPSEQQRIVKSE